MELSKLHFEHHDSCEALTASIMSLPSSDRRERRFTCAQNGTLWVPSSTPSHVYVLLEGRIEIRAADADGRYTRLQMVDPGQMFGHLCFCSQRLEPMATEAFALTKSTLLRTSVDSFAKALRQSSLIATHLLSAVCAKAAAADERVRMLAIHNARKRLLTLLHDLYSRQNRQGSQPEAKALLHVSHADLASIACLTRTHVTTLMNRLRLEGVISYQRGSAIRLNVPRISSALHC
jgi:CRP/FNR family transcriptional regulator, cyclic AMP receptor protein